MQARVNHARDGALFDRIFRHRNYNNEAYVYNKLVKTNANLPRERTFLALFFCSFLVRVSEARQTAVTKNTTQLSSTVTYV